MTPQTTFVAPAGPIEERLATIWRELLQVDRVSRTDNFFDLGGHSLLAMQVIVRLEDELGHRINPRELFLQTLEQLAASLASV